MKRIVSFIMAFVFVLVFMGNIAVMAEEKMIYVTVDGEAVKFDVLPQIINDRTMVPVRAISEAFGCTVNWDNDTKTVEITN